MGKIETDKLESLMVDLANGEPDMALLNEIRQKTAGMDCFINPTGNEAVLLILGGIARHVLDQAMMGAGTILYGEQVSGLGFHHRRNGLLAPRRFDTMASFKPLPGFGLDAEPRDIQVAYRMFGGLIEGGTLFPERIGKCHCGRYFRSVRLGQKKSRACSPAHRAVLSSRELRADPDYKERANIRDAKRIAAVRKAGKLVSRWNLEGKSPQEKERLLRDWNEENGSILGKRSFFNILEKGVGTPGAQSKKEGVPK